MTRRCLKCQKEISSLTQEFCECGGLIDPAPIPEETMEDIFIGVMVLDLIPGYSQDFLIIR